MHSPGRRPRRAGFTLIEVMLVIAIVVALATIVGISVIGQKDEADKGTAKIQMNRISTALDAFYLKFNRFPYEEEGLEVLWSKETLDVEDESAEESWQRFLEKPTPNDPWGTPWGYRDESEYGNRYDLWSNGPDREEGTDDDITSWSEEAEDGGAMPSMPTS